MDKPFKGVISGWQLNTNRVDGICVFHTDYSNGIARGYPITTSEVKRIFMMNGALTLETKNSYYVLV